MLPDLSGALSKICVVNFPRRGGTLLRDLCALRKTKLLANHAFSVNREITRYYKIQDLTRLQSKGVVQEGRRHDWAERRGDLGT